MPDAVEKDLVVYLLMRTDLPSLNSGKGFAHAFHAGNQIIKHMDDLAPGNPLVHEYIEDGNFKGADFFNTCLCLGATKLQIETAVEMANKLGFVGNVVIDPTYPFLVDTEIAKLMSETVTITSIRMKGNVLALRRELSCGWIMGDKNDPVFRAIVGALDLHP